jgi:GT2 family glycosyltransferase
VLTAANEGDVVVLMNNDTWVAPDFFTRAERAVSATPGAILCPLVVDDRDGSTLCKSGAVNRSWAFSLVYRPYEGHRLSERSAFPKLTAIDFMRAQASIVPVGVLRSIGNLAAELPHYHGDSEYAWRARRRGVGVFIDRDLEIYHTVAATGAFNAFTPGARFRDFVRSLSDIRSVNCLRYKWRYARLCCPKALLPIFMVMDTAKITCRSMVTILVGERTASIRTWINNRMRR